MVRLNLRLILTLAFVNEMFSTRMNMYVNQGCHF